MSNRKALVIGAGIAGPATAMALQRVGIDATIYEAYPTTAHGVGGALGLAPNGIDALTTLGAGEAVLAAGCPSRYQKMANGAGRTLVDVDLGVSSSNMWLWRADLYRELHEETIRRGIPIEHGKRLAGVGQDGDQVVARFEDGTTAVGDVLIGADGMRSRVRSLIDPNAPAPQYVGLVGTGGRATGVPLPAKPGTFGMIFGKRAFFGYLTVAEAAGDEVWWFANLPTPAEPSPAELAASSEEITHRLYDLFDDDRAIPIRELVAATSEPLGLLPMHSMDMPASWHRGRMALVGDSAHVTSPSSGQGASLALEDALVLAQCLRDREEPGEAFALYQREREDRVRRVFDSAKRTNQAKAAGPVGRVVRDLLFPVFAKKMMNPDASSWLFGHHIEFDEPVGV